MFAICMIAILHACFHTVLFFEKLIYDGFKKLPPFDCTQERYQSIELQQA